MKRRDAREAAFLIVFESMFQQEVPISVLVNEARECRELEVDGYSVRLSTAVANQAAELDETIGSYLANWKLERLPKVTLAILRLALCELREFSDIPVGVTINEAVEIAKKYASEEDASYINGVLGAYVKAVPPQKDPDPKDVKKD